MKHAVMIMAHKNLEQVVRLINTLNCGSFDFYVHFDSNFKLSQNDISKINSAGDNVFFCGRRIHGELDKWSLPQIIINLIDFVLENEKKMGFTYSYFLLLSGQDYPIKSNEYILSFLEERYPLPLVDVESYEDEHWVQTKFMLVRWPHKIEEIHGKMKSGIWRKFRVAPYVIAEKLERMFYGTPYERLSRLGVRLYGGSQWWILPHGVIDYIISIRKNNLKIIKEFKRTWTPEETFFQTMVMNSPFAELVLQESDIYENGDQRCMTYANFVTPTKPFRGHPHDITAEDYDRIMAKKQLFARKFDINTDSQVFDMIDSRIKSK